MNTRCLTVAFALALSISGASAQPVVSAKAGLISYAEGRVFLDDHGIEITATHFPEVKENGVLRTEAGRAEVLLAPCAALRVGPNSSLRMLASAIAATRVELLAGSAVVDAGELHSDSKLTLSVGGTRVIVLKQGTYRFDAAPPTLKVFAGSARVERDNAGWVAVGAERMLSLLAPAPPVKFGKGAADELDTWSRKRSAEQAKASGSLRYQTQQARALAQAATEAASSGATSNNPDYRDMNGRSAPPPSTIFPNPARTGVYGLPGCVEAN
jgi:hypothetical protein